MTKFIFKIIVMFLFLQTLCFADVKIKNELLLDKYSAIIGLSLDKIKTDYNDGCIRARRSNDNNEQNINFQNNTLDTTALLSFTGSNSGYVPIWNDQSGNGNNATQSTSGNQPRIVNSGVYDGNIYFDGAGQHLRLPDNILTNIHNFTIVFKIAVNTRTSIWPRIFSFSNVDNSKSMYFTYDTGSDNFVYSIYNDVDYYEITGAYKFEIGRLTEVVIIQDGTTLSIYIDKVLIVSDTVALTPYDLGNTSNYIGQSASNISYYAGTMRSFIIFDKAIPINDL